MGFYLLVPWLLRPVALLSASGRKALSLGRRKKEGVYEIVD